MRLLLVEDEKKVASHIKKGLEEEGYAVDVVNNGEDASSMVRAYDYDLIILDVMLPGKNGIQILKELRDSKQDTPVIFLTAKNSTEEKILGLDLGADDYLTKPFEFEELCARVRAILRRHESVKTSKLVIADLELNPVTHEVKRAGQRIDLTQKEYALLEYLLYNQGKILTRTMIVEHVWDQDFDSFTNVVDVYVNHLRTKLDQPFEKKLLQTVRGFGYVLREQDASHKD
ncbi:MAG: heavy metal response regulator transcription factor [Deltaproteobacteria bacterium]|nr:heavy metal response regulator transcription factor [Deltaproteobacteria bacterium]